MPTATASGVAYSESVPYKFSSAFMRSGNPIPTPYTILHAMGITVKLYVNSSYPSLIYLLMFPEMKSKQIKVLRIQNGPYMSGLV